MSSHTAAHPERGEARFLQASDNFSGSFARRWIHEIHSHAKAQRRKVKFYLATWLRII